MAKKLVSVVSSCFNEEENIGPLVERLKAVFAKIPQVDWELILLDNASTDGTVCKAKELCAQNPNVRLIVNARNFGHVRSPFHGLMQAKGDAAILIASDLEDPPELIEDFVLRWEQGFDVVAGVYQNAQSSSVLSACRSLYYWSLDKLADARPISSFTGFALYSRRFLEIVRNVNDPYPYLRGMVSEIGLPTALVPFEKPARISGVSKSNFFVLVDMAISGFVSMSRAPARLATLAGGFLSAVSFLMAMAFLVSKLIFWKSFALGMAPLLIGMFFFSSIQLLFLGLIGEYVSSIHQKNQNRPLLVEKERVGFPSGDEKPVP